MKKSFLFSRLISLGIFTGLIACGGGESSSKPFTDVSPTTEIKMPVISRGFVVDQFENYYINGIDTILKINASGNVTLFAGQTGIRGTIDGIGSKAQFANLGAMAIDNQGNLYVIEGSHLAPGSTVDFIQRAAVRKITPEGVVSTLAGSRTMGNASDVGNIDGLGTDARFSYLTGIAVTPDGNVFVADQGARTIRKINSQGFVTTIAGTPNSHGYIDGLGSAAKFYSMSGMVNDAEGNLYVLDSLDHINFPDVTFPNILARLIRKITPNGLVTTLTKQLPLSIYGSGGGLTINIRTGKLYYSNGTSIYSITPSGAVSDLNIPVGPYATFKFVQPNNLAILDKATIKLVPVAD